MCWLQQPLHVLSTEMTSSADFNVRGMNVWSSLGGLAQFPGTLVLGDARPAQEAYPSEGVSPESMALLEPCLCPTAAAQGARLYRQEGGQPIDHQHFNALAGLVM